MTTSPFDADRPPEPERRRRRGGGTGGPGGRGSGRRRPDPTLMVPEAEFTSYYGRPVIKAPPWKYEIAAYLFLGGVAGGSGLLGAGAHVTGRELLRRNSRVSALVAIALGGAALTADLGRPERAINMMRTVKLTSPMSVGTWILTAFGGSAGASMVAEIGRHYLPSTSLVYRGLGVVEKAGDLGSAAFSAPLAAYTAVLLSDTAAPTWHASYRELPFVFVGSANAAASGLALVTTPTSQTAPARRLAVIGATMDLVADRLMERRLGDLAEPYHEGRAHRLALTAKVLTAGGALGAVVLGGRRAPAVISGLALLAGSVCTRFSVFEAGMASARDPRYTVQPQKARVEQALREGRAVTQPPTTPARTEVSAQARRD